MHVRKWCVPHQPQVEVSVTGCLQVLVVHPDCQVEERIETAEALGLAPRDTSLFAPQPLGVSGQRATIVPRENALLVRTEIARAIIHQDKTVLFPCR